MTRARRQLWSELVPYSVLSDESLLRALRERNIGLNVAVTPERRGAAAAMLDRCSDNGVRVAIWHLVSDSRGRWASRANAHYFRDATLRFLDSLSVLPSELIVDIEPPIELLRGVLAGQLHACLRVWRLGGSAAPLARLVDDAHARGMTVTATVPPMVALGAPYSDRGWERLLGAPLAAFDRVNIMMYSSLLVGYSRGWLRRRDATALLGLVARAAGKRFGQKASLSLGVTGVGALGDEPVYRSVAELEDDARIACDAGITDLALFSLGGILTRPPRERWLDAFATSTTAAPTIEPMTARATSLVLALRAVGCLRQVTR